MDKRKKEYKAEKIQIKMTARELARARYYAKQYARGNLSKWIRHAIENAPREILE